MPDVPALSAADAAKLEPGAVLYGWKAEKPPYKGWHLIEQPLRVITVRLPDPATLRIEGVTVATGQRVTPFDIDLFTRVLVAFRPLDGHCPTCGHNQGACDG